MKLNCWLLFGTMMLSSGLLAQQVTNAPPASPIETPAPAAVASNTAPADAAVASAPTTNAPAAKPVKKKTPARKKAKPAAHKPAAAAELKTVPLTPGPATVVATHVNVRGQPKLRSEVLARLDKGETVTVLEEITRNNSAVDEPSAWAKILLPTNAPAWVNTSYLEPADQSVKPRRLNVRSGPGENFSVLGRLQKGDVVKEITTKGEWTRIEPPTNAYAFVAAQFLNQEAPPTPAAPTLAQTGTTPAPPAQPETPATPATVSEPPVIAAAPTEPPATPAAGTPAPTNAAPEIAAATPATPAAVPPAPPVEEPPPKRIVQREGIVRGTVSIQAPTHFAIYSPDNGQLIDYLYTTSHELDLRRYKGLRIVVTGEEGLDERWANTPVITIQKIQVMEDFPPNGL